VQELQERDERDQGHGRSTLDPSPGAVPVDTTGLPIDDVVRRIVELVPR
jgi:cytidylate kinase